MGSLARSFSRLSRSFGFFFRSRSAISLACFSNSFGSLGTASISLSLLKRSLSDLKSPLCRGIGKWDWLRLYSSTDWPKAVGEIQSQTAPTSQINLDGIVISLLSAPKQFLYYDRTLPRPQGGLVSYNSSRPALIRFALLFPKDVTHGFRHAAGRCPSL